MKWWNRLLRATQPSTSIPGLSCVRIDLLPHWHLVRSSDQDATWQDREGDELKLHVNHQIVDFPRLLYNEDLRADCRAIAEKQGGGLIEARVVYGRYGPAARLIYKQLEKPAFVYTGMLFQTMSGEGYAWTIRARERGMTGMREAVLMLALSGPAAAEHEEFERCWAQDPYDPDYQGVDRTVLRYMSDDERFDSNFPNHPLSKVRRVLEKILWRVELVERPLTLAKNAGEKGMVRCKMDCPQEGDPEELHTLTYGARRVHYQHDEIFGLPAVCICDITGPGLPSLRITPEGVEPTNASDLPEGEGRIVFENGTDDASRMTFPIFNPNEARKPDWKTKRRPPGYPWIAPASTGKVSPSGSPRSIQYRLSAIRTCSHNFGRHYVVYYPSLFPNEPTVRIMSILGPGLPNLRITPEGVEPTDETGIGERQGCVHFSIVITRGDLLSN